MNLSITFLAFGTMVEGITEHWASPEVTIGKILVIAVLVFLNAFFVAAEFGLVKVRLSQLEALAEERNPRAAKAKAVVGDLDASLSACQLGITLASLGLGWVGERFLAELLQPFFRVLGISSPAWITSISFFIAFSIITFLHIVLGEQAPKILAI